MSSRARRLAIFLPVIVTLALAGIVGGLIVVQNQRQADEVTRATELAETFLDDVGTFQTEVAREVRGVRDTDPGALKRVLDAAIEDPPVLEEGPAYGMEQSEVYARARRTSESFLAPYTSLSKELRRADIALEFIAAAREALSLRATDFVGGRLLSDSGPIRSRLIPAFAAARDELAAVRVPRGQDELAATVVGALQYVIDQATALADSIEGNRSYSFTYGEQFQAAIDAVESYAATVNGDLTEALDVVATS